jgi:hypothetical protein
MIPLAVDSARNVAFGFVTKSGYDAIAEVALDGTGAGKLLMARGDVDVDGLIRIGRKNRVVGARATLRKSAKSLTSIRRWPSSPPTSARLCPINRWSISLAPVRTSRSCC